MTTDELYVEAFKVGDKYTELLNKVATSAFDTVSESVRDNTVDYYAVGDVVEDECERWLGSWVMYPLYVVMHFGIYDAVGGCDYEDSPSELFKQDVQERVESLLEYDNVVID